MPDRVEGISGFDRRHRVAGIGAVDIGVTAISVVGIGMALVGVEQRGIRRVGRVGFDQSIDGGRVGVARHSVLGVQRPTRRALHLGADPTNVVSGSGPVHATKSTSRTHLVEFAPLVARAVERNGAALGHAAVELAVAQQLQVAAPGRQRTSTSHQIAEARPDRRGHGEAQ